jgi:hypothetical protein
MKASIEDVRRLKPRANEVFRRFAPLAGVGITKVGDGYALKVNFRETPKAMTDLPRSLDGVPVVCEVVGKTTKRHIP